MERISHWIGGKIVPGESGRTGPVYDPATGEQTHEVDFATTEEVGQAVAAAAEAFPAWRATSLSSARRRCSRSASCSTTGRPRSRR